MANPMYDEQELWERIEKENITMHPVLWELIDHHLRNNLNFISIPVGVLSMVPAWILKAASFVIRFLYKASGQRGSPPQSLVKTCNVCVKGFKESDKFLKKLKAATKPKEDKL